MRFTGIRKATLASLVFSGLLVGVLGCTSPADETPTPTPPSSPIASQVVSSPISTPSPVPSQVVPSPTSPPSPVPSEMVPSPTPQAIVSRELAVAAAEAALARDSMEATGVQDMRNTVARLMFAGDLGSQFSLTTSPVAPGDLVWVVQVEGVSLAFDGAGGQVTARKYRFNAAVVDVETGAVVERLTSATEPIILPAYFYNSRSRERDRLPFDLTADPFGMVEVSKDEAIASIVASIEEQYGIRWTEDMWDLESVEYELVQLVPEDQSGPGFVYPTSSPLYVTPTPHPPGTAFPLAWDIVVAEKFNLGRCEGVSFPPVPSSGSESFRCWPAVHTYRVDASTGAVARTGNRTGVGPRLSDEEYAVLERHAEMHGWWSVWHTFNESTGFHPDDFAYEELVAALADWS